MHVIITFLLGLGAFVLGTILGGVLGDRGSGLDLTPVLLGAFCAALAVWARVAARRHGTEQ